MSTTPIIQNLLTLCHDYGRELASNFLEGESAIGGTMDDELTEFLARRDVSWDSLTIAEQDKIRDEALEAFKSECARRIVKSDLAPAAGNYTASDGKMLTDAQGRQYQTRFYTPETPAASPSSLPSPVLFGKMKAALLASHDELSAYHATGRPSGSIQRSETLISGLGDLLAEINRVPVAADLQLNGSDSDTRIHDAISALSEAYEHVSLRFEGNSTNPGNIGTALRKLGDGIEILNSMAADQPLTTSSLQ